MLTAAQRDRFTVVLVGARNPQNIGAAARAMQDFGFGSLRFVNHYVVPLEGARATVDAEAAAAGGYAGDAMGSVTSAVGARAVLAEARAYPSVAEAVADCSLVVGTTAIGARAVEHRLLPIVEAATGMRDALSDESAGRVALLFGSEKTGLTNDQLSHCAWLTTIPLYEPENARHLSMNLGQAVAVCLYELAREGFEGARALPTGLGPAATGDDRERLTHLLLDVMRETEYMRRYPANARETVVRKLVQSLGKDAWEAQTWMGILRMVLGHARRER